MDPSQAVARIQRVQLSGHNIGPVGTPGYIAGQFYRIAQTPGLGAGNMTKVHALVIRGDMAAVPKENMLLAIGDRIRTGPGIVLLVEFLIGGRVSINQSTE